MKPDFIFKMTEKHMIYFVIQMGIAEKITDIMADYAHVDGKFLLRKVLFDQPVRAVRDNEEIIFQKMGIAQAFRR